MWSSSPKTYCKNAIEVIEQLLLEEGEGYTLKSKVKNLLADMKCLRQNILQHPFVLNVDHPYRGNLKAKNPW